MQTEKLRFEEETLKFRFDDDHQPPARIKVLGIGGAGGNAVNRMIQAKIGGVEFIAANTDIQALRSSMAPIKLQIGAKLTNGLGCGAVPEKGRQAALEDTERIIELLDGADMIFVTAGMGGGTGTGAAPIVASLATELGALTVGVVTKPFGFEGKKRTLHAEEGINELKEVVDTLITIPNERLLAAMGPDALLEDSFRYADDVLCQAVQGISDIITMPGIVNVDFADVRTIMSGKGMALMGTGVAEGENRAVEAAQRAISSPLLEETSIRGARGVLINITASRESLRLHEVDAAAKIIEEVAGAEETIFGAVYDEKMGDRIKITVIATGFNQNGSERAKSAGDHMRAVGNVIPLTSSESNKTIDYQLASIRDNLDEPAFRRRRAE
ncbi:MAG: cell division protein FtsZ [Acidobacteriota bacterium]|jgi:cell division protein FtsZ|nr:cell division protein FtsZ [Acidobacteriota bacterium]